MLETWLIFCPTNFGCPGNSSFFIFMNMFYQILLNTVRFYVSKKQHNKDSDSAKIDASVSSEKERLMNDIL